MILETLPPRKNSPFLRSKCDHEPTFCSVVFQCFFECPFFLILCRQARQGVPPGTPGRVRSSVWWSDCLTLCLFLRGPQPVTCVSRAPVFQHFFHHFFGAHFWTTPASKIEPVGAPKTAKSSQNDFLRRAPKTRMEKVAQKCIFQKAGYAIRTRLCSPNTLF